MFHQLIFIILLCAVIIITTHSDVRLFYHLFYKHDYLEWSADKMNDDSGLQYIKGSSFFKMIYTIAFGVCIFGIILIHFALFWLSKSFDIFMLTHVAATSLLLTILGNFITLFTYPIPGVTEVQLEKPKILLDVMVTCADYCCLLYMAIQVVKWCF